MAHSRTLLQVFDENQMHIFTLGKGMGHLPEQLLEPAGLFIDKEDRLYVSERGNHRVQVFQIKFQDTTGDDPLVHEGGDGQEWASLKKPGSKKDDDEELERLPPIKLELIFTLGQPGHLPNHFSFPIHMCTNTFEQLFVADSLNHRVQVTSMLQQGCSFLIAALVSIHRCST